MTPHS